MKKIMLPIAAVALVGLYAGTASAQCAFDGLAKTKGIKSSMIRAFAGCPSTENPVINTETQGGTPACEPVTPKESAGGPATTYLFGPKGECKVDIKAKVEDDCSEVEDQSGTVIGLPPGPCHVTYVKAKCKDILQADDATPINANEDAGWSLATLSRATMNDATNGDMTVIDFPVTFLFQDPDDGKLEVDSSSAEALATLVGVASAALPTCTQIQVVDLTIKDPAGQPFAVQGGSTIE